MKSPGRCKDYPRRISRDLVKFTAIRRLVTLPTKSLQVISKVPKAPYPILIRSKDGRVRLITHPLPAR